jgi:hypothetical protein
MPFSWVKDADPSLNVFTDGAPGAALDDDQRRHVKSLMEMALAYLRDNAPTHPGLASAIDEMVQAVAVYQAGQTNDPYYPFRRVVQAIEKQRQIDPSIPKP